MRTIFLPVILPIANAWVVAQERRILGEGVALDPAQLADAEALGLVEPGRVRVLHVDRIPFPAPWFTSWLERLGRCSTAQTAGLSARHGIYVRTDRRGDRLLLAHELAHTMQFERIGGIRPFLRQYLRECLTVGYALAPLEHEAEAAARGICGVAGF